MKYISIKDDTKTRICGSFIAVNGVREITMTQCGGCLSCYASKSPRRLTDGAVIQDGVLLARETNFGSETYVEL